MPELKCSRLRARLTPHLREYQHCKKLEEEEEENLLKAEEELWDVEEAQNIVQQAAEEVQNLVHARIASIVTKCLKAVYLDKAYEFQLRFEKKYHKTEAHPIFCRDGQILEKPVHGAGVGQIEVAAFALRLVSLMLLRPARRRLLVADEPWKSIHGRENRQRAAQLLVDLSHEYDIQIIMSTGLEWLRTGKVIHMGD